MFEKRGTHPNKPYRVAGIYETKPFIDRHKCPNCRRPGAEMSGHATIFRKTRGGNTELFDVWLMTCENCGHRYSVFFTGYGEWLEAGCHIANKLAKPGAGCYVMSSTIGAPQAWIRHGILALE